MVLLLLRKLLPSGVFFTTLVIARINSALRSLIVKNLDTKDKPFGIGDFTQELYSIYKINENGTNKYYKVFYATECGEYCY